MRLDESREFYRDFFAKDSDVDPLGYYCNRQRYEIVFRLIDSLELASEVRVLEVGSGSGRIAEWLSARFENVTAVDIGVFGQMRETIAESDIDFVLGGLPSLPFDGEFDLVVCSEVLEHLPTRTIQRDAVRELAAVTADNGTVVISTPNPMALRERVLDVIHYAERKLHDVEPTDAAGGQAIEHWIPPTELRSYISECFAIETHVGSCYTLPDFGTGLGKYLHPVSDFITNRNLAPDRGVYQYYLLTKE